ncbi:MAG: YceI family protein [Silvibacterium sp.]|jgi:polyisoprenoid-binding protein YceI
MRKALLSLVAAVLLTPLGWGQVPIFEVTPVSSSVTFDVKSSVSIVGKFDQWKATLTMKSPDVTTAMLDIEVQAASVNTGSGMKNDKLKSKDFFDVDQDPVISFKSDHCVQTGPNTFDVPGIFTIRGVSKPQTLQLTLTGKGTGSGEIKGSMYFDRKDYGINGRIPFVTIADRVQVDVDLKAKRVSGPPVVFKQ